MDTVPVQRWTVEIMDEKKEWAPAEYTYEGRRVRICETSKERAWEVCKQLMRQFPRDLLRPAPYPPNQEGETQW